MIYVGIDMGSTATKVITRGEKECRFLVPAGWNSKETAAQVKDRLQACEVFVGSGEVVVAATGYGRISVDYADHVITEITCHGRGGYDLLGRDCTIIDVGGQDTKVIQVVNGKVVDFIMNDKCSAGTGKFVEIMAGRLGTDIDRLFQLAESGNAVSISSLCTVFAESEVISYIGQGRAREDIAAGVIDSVATKVAQLCERKRGTGSVLLTGGLSRSSYFAHKIGEKIGSAVELSLHGYYAGALGAAIIAQEKQSL